MGAAPIELMSTIDDAIHPTLGTAAANREPGVWIFPDVLEVDRFTRPAAPRLLGFGAVIVA